MNVAKLTAKDGRVFYTDKPLEHDDLREYARRMKGCHQVDIIEMTEAEYRAIPATVDAAEVFGQV